MKLISNRRYVYVKKRIEKDNIFLKFQYNATLLKEIKNMDGAKWHPKTKEWSIKVSERNFFQLEFLKGNNPYKLWDLPLRAYTPKRPLYEHQKEMLNFVMTRHFGILACEMGTGKTLVAIEAMEKILDDSPLISPSEDLVWYIGPKSGVTAVQMELIKWDSKYQPSMFTYEGLVKQMNQWIPGKKAPRFVIFDESSKIKTPTAQRSIAAKHLADSVRADWGTKGYIIEMTGTPSPKTPVDFYHQCEVACPGFLKEGNIKKFKKTLCLTEMREGLTGAYPHLITWFDDERKCSICGEFKEHQNHSPELILLAKGRCAICGEQSNYKQHLDLKDIDYHIFEQEDKYHIFVQSVNEVARLHKRMRGLVLVKFKKDCIDLPELIEVEIHIKPTSEMLRAMRLIKSTSERAITALSKMRELSDGFQYIEEIAGKETCKICLGHSNEENPCDACGNTGVKNVYKRVAKEIGTTKDRALLDLLDEYDDYGRLVIWAGFTASIERLIKMLNGKNWAVLRVDGKDVQGVLPDGNILKSGEFLQAMDLSHKNYDKLRIKYPRLAVVGNSKAGGMAYTFTAAPAAIYYSNSFDGEARMQSIHRIHRVGMDENRSPKIIDLITLPSDLLVLRNLKIKGKLQNMSLGQLNDELDAIIIKGGNKC